MQQRRLGDGRVAVAWQAPACRPAGRRRPARFWFWIALVTSDRRQREAVELSVSSQMRIAYCEPNTLTLPTP